MCVSTFCRGFWKTCNYHLSFRWYGVTIQIESLFEKLALKTVKILEERRCQTLLDFVPQPNCSFI